MLTGADAARTIAEGLNAGADDYLAKPFQFDELVARDVPPKERARLYRAHQLLVQAGPPPELSPELDEVPWPEDALAPLWGRPKRTGFRRPPGLPAEPPTARSRGHR